MLNPRYLPNHEMRPLMLNPRYLPNHEMHLFMLNPRYLFLRITIGFALELEYLSFHGLHYIMVRVSTVVELGLESELELELGLGLRTWSGLRLEFGSELRLGNQGSDLGLG